MVLLQEAISKSKQMRYDCDHGSIGICITCLLLAFVCYFTMASYCFNSEFWFDVFRFLKLIPSSFEER